MMVQKTKSKSIEAEIALCIHQVEEMNNIVLEQIRVISELPMNMGPSEFAYQ